MKPTHKQVVLATFFDALAHPRRQMLFQILRAAGENGMAVHHLLDRTKLTPATLAFHLRKMQDGRILTRKTKGCETWFSINHGPFSQLKAY